ncbi:Proline-rich protein 23A [Myotis davidii]|uniref:Proline-rich protein 23A n=1 Tax=Myotis davidii TaxID=225400 RepID=L5M4K0_MYODS|nr:Proline-rich protein 23A [Myotis davidii]
MIGSRLLSPSFHAAPWRGPQSGGPGPAKRRRIEEPAGPEDGMAPSLQGPQAADALTSVLLPLDGGVDLVLQPEPTSVLQVSLGGHTLLLVPETLLGPGAGPHPPVGPEPGAALGAPAGGVAIQQGFFCAFAPHIAVPAEARRQDEDAAPGFLTPSKHRFLGSLSLLHERLFPPLSPSAKSILVSPLLLPQIPSSPLQALPPSPSPGPQVRPRRPLGPAPKARKRLFQE